MAGPALMRECIDTVDAPLLVMQSNPRQVVTANRTALQLFGKDLSQVEGHRGGEVFDCRHSFTEAGCGQDVNCADCRIKAGVVDTFGSEMPLLGISTQLNIVKGNDTRAYRVRISTAKIGGFALVRIDRFEKA